jgi:hypothetical protein
MLDRDRLGQNGKSYYCKHFDLEQLITDLVGHLTKTIEEYK